MITKYVALVACALVPLIESSPSPQTLVYGHDRDVPLPLLVGGSDLAFVDWDEDGLKDILVSPNGEELLLRRNIGTKSHPRFANVYQEEPVALKDSRVGRFFALSSRPGVPASEGALPSIFSFEKHASLSDISVEPLKLNLFVPRRENEETEWQVVPALWDNGQPIEAFADTWICPSIAVVDWNADGKDDLLIGGWHPSVAQPGGKYTAGFNHPQHSWNPMAGRVYIMINASDGKRLVFEKPSLVHADGKEIETYGFVYPNTEDIDGDGLFDLVIGEQRPGLKWYRNVGNEIAPSFGFAGYLSNSDGEAIKGVLSLRAYFEDLDGDGEKEMYTTSYFAFSMGLLRFEQTTRRDGNLSRDWRSAGMLPMAGDEDTPVTAQGICSVEVTDWNGDGVRDLLLGAEPGTPMVLLNLGTNANPVWEVPRRLKFVNGDPLEYYGIEIGLGSVWGPIEFYLERVTPRLADWNGDGVEDMITGSMGARLLWLPGIHVDGELRFERPRVFTLNEAAMDVAHRVQPALLDFDEDGDLDVIALDERNVATLWRGDGTSSLSDPRTLEGPEGAPLKLNPSEKTVISGRRGLALVDWNRDGALDLITYNAFGPRVWGGHVRLHLGDTEHRLRFQAPIALFEIVSHHNGGVAIVDWDDDGYLDILVGGDHQQLRLQSEPRGQFFVFSGRNLPVPPALR